MIAEPLSGRVRAARRPGGPIRPAITMVISLLVLVLSCGTSAGGPAGGRGLVVGDSLVTVASRAHTGSAVRLVGYSGRTPRVYNGASFPQMAADLAAAGHPKTVILNWNGNNPREMIGTELVAAYHRELTADIQWYLRNGVTRVILAAAVPSVFNNADREVDWTKPDSAAAGRMLGSTHLNTMYRQLADEFPRKVTYSEKAARAIHPEMTFNTTLDGHDCIVDFIHPAPYCAELYARALENLL